MHSEAESWVGLGLGISSILKRVLLLENWGLGLGMGFGESGFWGV